MYKYTNLTFTELVNKIGGARYWNLPAMLKEILSRLTPQAPKYKVYTALLTQSGTDAPIATVLENTLGDIVWSRGETAGIYFATLSGAFTVNKTYIQCENTFDGTFRVVPAMESSSQPDVLAIYNRKILDNDIVDSIDSAQVEIRVYS